MPMGMIAKVRWTCGSYGGPTGRSESCKERASAWEQRDDALRERDDARDVLEEISLYLSSGIGDENTTAQQYKERILDGIKHLAGHAWEERWKFERERDEALEESLEQARLLGISGERECKIIAERDEAGREILCWENKWNIAVGMAAIAENERDLLKEELINLEDQRDLAMKVIKRLEAQLAQKEQ
jgi:hypothetical protein